MGICWNQGSKPTIYTQDWGHSLYILLRNMCLRHKNSWGPCDSPQHYQNIIFRPESQQKDVRNQQKQRYERKETVYFIQYPMLQNVDDVLLYRYKEVIPMIS